MTWPEGLRSHRMTLTGRARDLLTDADGRPQELDSVALCADVDRADGSRLVELVIRPDVRGAEALVDERVASGFRAAVTQHLPEQACERTPLFLLLDDLPACLEKHPCPSLSPSPFSVRATPAI